MAFDLVSTQVASLVPDSVRNKLIYVLFGGTALACAWIFGSMYISVVKRGVQNLIDRNRLNRNGFPTRVYSSEVYEACLAYGSSEVRRLYLEGLRRRRVPLVGEVTPAPEELMESPLVAEELARLREQWLGLAG